MKYILLFNFVLMSWGYSYSQDKLTIYIDEAIKRDLLLSEIVDEIEYVPLETTGNGLVDSKFANYHVTEKYIIAKNHAKGLYLFDRNTGKFIREISRYGNGPNEYSYFTIRNHGFDETTNTIYVDDQKSWKGFNIENDTQITTINKPMIENNSQHGAIKSFIKIGDNNLSFVNNISGNDTIRLVLYDNQGKVLKTYRNYRTFNKISQERHSSSGYFYNYKGSLYFNDGLCCDTVYKMGTDKLIHHIIFDMGDKKSSYYHHQDEEYNIGKYQLQMLYETNENIYFNIYIKTSKARAILKSCYYHKPTRKLYTPTMNDKAEFFKNDIDGLPPVWIKSVNSRGEGVYGYDPEDLVDLKLDKNNKLYDVVSKLEFDDNPVVVIMKLK